MGSFEEFVHTRSQALLRLSYGLTREHALAEDLLQTSLARVWPVWNRISGDPEPYVRKVIVNTHNSWWRRKVRLESPAESVPDQAGAAPQSAVDNRDEVWRALGRLPKRQQAVLVLRYFEDLSEAQIAETLNMAPGTVKSYASKGLATLRADPSLVTIPEAPEHTERLTAVKERVKQRRRTRIIATVAVIIVLLAIAVTGTPLLQRWSMEPPAGPAKVEPYIDGYRIVVGQLLPLSDTGTVLTWTPSTLDLTIQVECAHVPNGRSVYVSPIINRAGTHLFGCGNGKSQSHPNRQEYSPRFLEDAGLKIGEPATLTLLVGVIDETKPGQPGGDLPAGWMAVAIGEKMAFADYPLPPAPKTLKPLDYDHGNGTALTVSRDDNHGLAGWPLDGQLCAQSQTPGFLHIVIDGHPAMTFEWWDYAQTIHCQPITLPHLGGKVSPWADRREWLDAIMTVTAEHMTGDWYLRAGPQVP